MKRTIPVSASGRIAAFIPFAVFVIFYLGVSLAAGDFYKVPMPVSFIVAAVSAMLLFPGLKLACKVEVYARAMGQVDIMMMCLIFILAGAFAAVTRGMGAVDSTVNIARHFIPGNLMLPGVFLVACFISLAMGTSCGTIAALTPIAAGLVGPLGISPELMLGAVIGGAMFGDNMSVISDTTIAATRTQRVRMKDKFLTNFRIALPAALIVVLIYVIIGRHSGCAATSDAAVGWPDAVKLSPYLLVLLLALTGANVMVLLFFGTVISGSIGIVNGTLDFYGTLALAWQGILGMTETMMVAMLAGGLLGLIRFYGGIGLILEKIQRLVRGTAGCEIGVFLLVSLVNLFTANNTVAIVITGPLAREISQKFHCDARRIASILDSASCAVQGLIPYGAQLLIAVGLAGDSGIKIAPPALMSTLFYPILLGLMLLISIFCRRRKNLPEAAVK